MHKTVKKIQKINMNINLISEVVGRLGENHLKLLHIKENRLGNIVLGSTRVNALSYSMKNSL